MNIHPLTQAVENLDAAITATFHRDERAMLSSILAALTALLRGKGVFIGTNNKPVSVEKTSSGWQTADPPKDGTAIMAFGRIIYTEEACTQAEPFWNQIRWTENQGESKGWHFTNGMSVAQMLSDEVIIDHWIQLPELGTK